MRNHKKRLRSEEGSAAIEFLALTPFIILVFLIFWQLLITGYSVVVARSAVNEAAKVYSVTGIESEAVSAGEAILGSGGAGMGGSITIQPGGNTFKAEADVNMDIIFIPDDMVKGLSKVSFTQSVSGRLIK
ncbi:TadE/TadG family type IV pilus assembly protein [Bacillus marinisedimentorum]|uniref:TadE/TadG family type IV pilus assembly protein n=1 Tax=Bacillus marinisedimentorum TaxID=1821260 RepID=UPI0014711F0F|nr:hypothetical protein [Bacillus marinisedimentorum]